MRILKVYTDALKADSDLYSFGNMNYKHVVIFQDMIEHKEGYANIELANGVKIEFRVITSLEDAHKQISGNVYAFVEYHANFISLPADIRQFIQSRIRDPRDYS